MITNKLDIIVPISEIQEIVCGYYDVPFDQILNKTRKREIVQKRQVIMFFSRIYSRESLRAIGELNGGKDHATVIHAKKTINNLYDTDRKFREEIDEINCKIINLNEGIRRADKLKSEFNVEYNIKYLNKLSFDEYNALYLHLSIDKRSNITKHEIKDIIKDNLISVLIRHKKTG